MSILKNNFFTRAWKGEEKFWKVFLAGVLWAILLFILPLNWGKTLMPLVLLSITTPIFILLFNKCKRNVGIIKDRPLILNLINLFIVLLWIFYIGVFLLTIVMLAISFGSCKVSPVSPLCWKFF